MISPGGTVLDAPCGTGKYFPMLAAAGVRVAGADQSAGMLAKARARGIAFSLERASLQDLSHARQFDAVLPFPAARRPGVAGLMTRPGTAGRAGCRAGDQHIHLVGFSSLLPSPARRRLLQHHNDRFRAERACAA
jgi:SAM-dependent methyltransferase